MTTGKHGQQGDEGGKREGVDESRQDHAQDEAAKKRPGTQDQQIHDEHTRRPGRKESGTASP